MSKLVRIWGVSLFSLYVMYNFDRDTWVNFKLFGMLGMTMVFLVIQSLFLSRHISVPEKGDAGE
jgi:intracellular septation protein